MDVELRARRALVFLRDIGAFAACVPGAKPCAVVDIGAGQESPRNVIQSMGLNVKYLPVDYKARSEETIVCNLNSIEFPHAQLEGYNVVGFLALGSLEYVIHRWALVASLAMYPNAHLDKENASYGVIVFNSTIAERHPDIFTSLAAPRTKPPG
ncbi:hypothetical protein Rsub_12940 [Raphidocelis subcapitata]|uniref:Uncharacterized protein n=1 Tax=Raphidocelis subcapitata TaxID=307507 RepID=A0A2V0PRC8_9CHLO|nr:hypothetical protein Rsub_12940 [Raphidocelis subcapitata]|eukprot:GBF99825.1 hypothetical protein Rsub_12940 [Raphidocelis subcapitata]